MTPIEPKKPYSDEVGALAFYKMIKQDAVKFITAAVCVAGEAMEATNAETMDVSIEATFNDKPCKVTATFKLESL